MHAQIAHAVETHDGQRMALAAVAYGQRQGGGGGGRDAGQRRQAHGGMFDQRRVHYVVDFAELDDTSAGVGLQQCLGPRAAEAHGGLDQTLDLG